MPAVSETMVRMHTRPPGGLDARIWLDPVQHFAVIRLPQPPLIVKPPLRWTSVAIAAFVLALNEATQEDR